MHLKLFTLLVFLLCANAYVIESDLIIENGIRRYKRDVITSWGCPLRYVLFLGTCITCEEYKKMTDEDCPA